MPEIELHVPDRLEQAMVAGWSTFNERRLDDFVAVFTEDVEFHSAMLSGIDGEVFHGHDGVRDWWRRIHALFEGLNGQIEQAIAAGDVAVVVIAFHGTSTDSGVTASMRLFQVIRMRGDRVAHLSATTDPAAAFARAAELLG